MRPIFADDEVRLLIDIDIDAVSCLFLLLEVLTYFVCLLKEVL